MSLVDDVMTTEAPETREDFACAMQRVINDGQAWSMNGSMGRAMMESIRSGLCMLGLQQRIDAYGNVIPSRTQVADGTSGSRSFVVKHRGEEWAAMLEAAEVKP